MIHCCSVKSIQVYIRNDCAYDDADRPYYSTKRWQWLSGVIGRFVIL